MKYTVLTYFEDLKDNGFRYRKGDEYPRNGLKVTPERIKELCSADNLRQKPLIEPIDRNHITTTSSNFPPEEADKTASSNVEKVGENEETEKKKVKKVVKKTMKKPVKKANPKK